MPEKRLAEAGKGTAEAGKGEAEAGKEAAEAEKGVAEAVPLGEVVSPQCGDEAPSYPESTEVLIKRLLVFWSL